MKNTYTYLTHLLKEREGLKKVNKEYLPEEWEQTLQTTIIGEGVISGLNSLQVDDIELFKAIIDYFASPKLTHQGKERG